MIYFFFSLVEIIVSDSVTSILQKRPEQMMKSTLRSSTSDKRRTFIIKNHLQTLAVVTTDHRARAQRVFGYRVIKVHVSWWVLVNETFVLALPRGVATPVSERRCCGRAKPRPRSLPRCRAGGEAAARWAVDG